MTPESVFLIANTLILLPWLLLIVAPRWQWTRVLVRSGLFCVAYSLLYLLLIVLFFGQAEGGFSTLEGVAGLFQGKWTLLAAWVHYLVFDLLVGMWEVKDAEARGVPHLWVVPCLFFTFMLGPIGWLLYLLVRALRTKTWALEF